MQIPEIMREEVNASRHEIVARAMYESWAKRHKGAPSWHELVKVAQHKPVWQHILTGWMEDAMAAILAVRIEEDLPKLFNDAKQSDNGTPEDGYNRTFNSGLDVGLSVVRAWREAVLKGL